MSSGIYVLPGTQRTTFGCLDFRDDLLKGIALNSNSTKTTGTDTTLTDPVPNSTNDSIPSNVCHALDKAEANCDTIVSSAVHQFDPTGCALDRTTGTSSIIPAAFGSIPSSIHSVLDQSNSLFSNDTRSSVTHRNLFYSHELSHHASNVHPSTTIGLSYSPTTTLTKLRTADTTSARELASAYNNPSASPLEHVQLNGHNKIIETSNSQSDDGNCNQLGRNDYNLNANQSILADRGTYSVCKEGNSRRNVSTQLQDSHSKPVQFNATTNFSVFPICNTLTDRGSGLLAGAEARTIKQDTSSKHYRTKPEHRFGSHATRISARMINGMSRATKFTPSKRKDVSDENDPFGSTQTFSTGTSSSLSRSSYMCRKCRAHGKLLPVKQHKRNCPFRSCNCTVCSLVNRGRQIVAKQIALYRDQKTHSLATNGPARQHTTLRGLDSMDKFRVADGYAFKPLKNHPLGVDESSEDEGPHCRRCRNHGRSNPWKGHKKTCPYRCCTCQQCILISLRKSNEKDLREVVQEFNSERVEKRERTNTKANEHADNLLLKGLGSYKDDVHQTMSLNSNNYLHPLSGTMPLSSLGLHHPHSFFPYPYLSRLTEVYKGNKDVNSSRLSAMPLAQSAETTRLPSVLSHPFSMANQLTGQSLYHSNSNPVYGFNFFGSPSMNNQLNSASETLEAKLHTGQTNGKPNDGGVRETCIQEPSRVQRNTTLAFARGVAGVLLDTMANSDAQNIATPSFSNSNEANSNASNHPSEFTPQLLFETKTAHNNRNTHANYEPQTYFQTNAHQQSSSFGNCNELLSKAQDQLDRNTCYPTQAAFNNQALVGVDASSSGLWANPAFCPDLYGHAPPNAFTKVTHESMFRSLVESVTQQPTPIDRSLVTQSYNELGPGNSEFYLNVPSQTQVGPAYGTDLWTRLGNACGKSVPSYGLNSPKSSDIVREEPCVLDPSEYQTRAQQAAAFAAAAAAAVALQQEVVHHHQQSPEGAQNHQSTQPYVEMLESSNVFDTSSMLPSLTHFSNSRCDGDRTSLTATEDEHVEFPYTLGEQDNTKDPHRTGLSPKASPSQCVTLFEPLNGKRSYLNYGFCDSQGTESSPVLRKLQQQLDAKLTFPANPDVDIGQTGVATQNEASQYPSSASPVKNDKHWTYQCQELTSSSWPDSSERSVQNTYKAEEDKTTGYSINSMTTNGSADYKESRQLTFPSEKPSEDKALQMQPFEKNHSQPSSNGRDVASTEQVEQNSADTGYTDAAHIDGNSLTHVQARIRKCNLVSTTCTSWKHSATRDLRKTFMNEQLKQTTTLVDTTGAPWINTPP